jgi:hypothetical protein
MPPVTARDGRGPLCPCRERTALTTLKTCATKFANDWSMNLVSLLPGSVLRYTTNHPERSAGTMHCV